MIRRIWLLLGILALFALPAKAQYTAVSSTGVTDSSGIVYIGGTYKIVLVNTSNQPIYFQGAPLPNGLTQYNGTLSSTGSFTQTIPSSAFLLAGNNGPATGTTWSFTVCAVGNNGCYSVSSTVSGASQNLTSTINAAAVALTFPLSVPPGPSTGCLGATGTAGNTAKWLASCGGGGGGFTAGGDLSGTSVSQTVIGINGTLLSGLAIGFVKFTAGVPSTLAQIPIGSVGSAGLSATSPVTISSAGVIACVACSSSSSGTAFPIVTKTTTYSALSTDVAILCNGTFTITLPTTSITVGQFYRIKNTGTGVCTVSAGGSVNIDNATTAVISLRYNSIDVQWDGTQYWIF